MQGLATVAEARIAPDERYRIPIAIASGFLGLLFFWLLFDGSAAEKWIGGFGLVALVVWVFVFRAMFRRGY